MPAAVPAGGCRDGATHRRRHLHHPRPAHNTIDPAARVKAALNRWLRKLASLPRTPAPTASRPAVVVYQSGTPNSLAWPSRLASTWWLTVTATVSGSARARLGLGLRAAPS